MFSKLEIQLDVMRFKRHICVAKGFINSIYIFRDIYTINQVFSSFLITGCATLGSTNCSQAFAITGNDSFTTP